jgi:hypothetical protein
MMAAPTTMIRELQQKSSGIEPRDPRAESACLLRQLVCNVVDRRRVNSDVMPRRFENLAVWFRFTRRAEVANIARDE